MAHKEIPTITAASALDGLEQLHIVQGSNSRRVTIQEIIDFALEQLQNIESFIIPCSNETTPLAVAAGVFSFRMPYAFVPTVVRADVVTAPTGSEIEVDVKVGGVSIFTTTLTIDAGETTSVTAAVPAVLLADLVIASNAIVTVDIVAVGATIEGAGLKVTIIGRQDT